MADFGNRRIQKFDSNGRFLDAWGIDTDDSDKQVGRVGYEINFNRYFYTYTPPRPLEEIDAELKTLEADIAALLKEVVA